jgi:type I restriction enzyme M protein
MVKTNGNSEKVKSMESWIWGAACSIRGAADAPKFKEFILPLIFVKRLCDVFDDEIDRIAEKVKNRTKALQLVERDKKLVRFYLPIKPKDPENERTWDVIRKLSDKIGQELTDKLRKIAKENKDLQGIIDRIDFNATTHGQRDIDDDRLSKLIEKISEKRLGLKDVEPDIIGRSYEYLIRKFAEGSGKSAGEFYTPTEVGFIMAKIMDAKPGMEIYDPCCGSGGLLIKCELVMEEKMAQRSKEKYAPLQLHGQEFTAGTWAMSKMNMVIHDMEGEIENDELERFPAGPCGGKIDWGWIQHIYSSLNDTGRGAVVLDTGAASRGSGNQGSNKEKECRKWFVENDMIEGVIYLPENLFYNTSAPGIIIFLNKVKEHKDKIYLLHAGKEFEKGDPKNYITQEGIEHIAEAYKAFKEEDKFACLVEKDEIVKNDYNLSPSRYIQTNDAYTYRPIEAIVDELREQESEYIIIDAKMKNILEKLEI